MDAGAVTWCSGTTGTAGVVNGANSLIGSSGIDHVGLYGVTVLTNGNYVVRSPYWSNPVGPVTDAGAATWGNGSGGTTGLISAANSLIGGSTDDRVGEGGVTALTNGNYVVTSLQWNDPVGPKIYAGAVTWGNGATGTSGVVSGANSLIGSSANDYVGSSGVTALTNGNYVVASPGWTNPAGPIAHVGAVTWCNGTTATTDVVTAAKSLSGQTPNDMVGYNNAWALTNGNYVVSSPNWDNPARPIVDVGAATWGNGTTGTTGLVTAANSLIGSTASDKVANVMELTNGNYVVVSSQWDNPVGPVANVGAVTWGNGTSGTKGVVSATNSLIGGTANDQVGAYNITALTNGNYVVLSPVWSNPTGPVASVGAVTWGNGNGGTVGLVTPANSLIGSTAGDYVGSGLGAALANGSYVVLSPIWDNPVGPVVNAGAVTWGNGAGGTVGLVTSANSALGTATNGISNFSYDATRNRLFVGRGPSNIVSILPLSVADAAVGRPVRAGTVNSRFAYANRSG